MKLIHSMLLAAGLAIPMLGNAGNIPQYKVANKYTTGLDDVLGAGWEFITDGTQIGNSASLVPSAFFFADGTESINGYRGEGFPIGFNFRFGGNVFNQFTICPNGMIQLGWNEVDYRGCNIPFTRVALPWTVESPFIIGMSPIVYGVRSGDVRFKTVGEDGNRVLIVQFYKMILNDVGSTVDSRRSMFSLQMRLHEADGKIEMAFVGDRSYNSNGFFTGLHGWDQRDQAFVTGSVTSKKTLVSGELADILDHNTYIAWSEESVDNESFVLTFTPAPDTPATAGAPSDLKVMQNGSSAVVSCKKNKDADATMILYSYSPITAENFPADGTSPRVYDNNNEFATKMGDVTLIYYRDDDEPMVEIPEIKDQSTLYVAAVSVNGYPNFNTKDIADANMISTQLPPSVFYSDVDAEGITLNWESEYPVIVAYSPKAALSADRYYGVFGTPDIDAKAGDEIEGGGTVIYVGDGSEFFMPIDKLRPNYPNMFRIWNVKDDSILSATCNDTYGVPETSLPFEPDLENWPFAQLPEGYSSSDESWGWTPRRRFYDNEFSFNGTLPDNEKEGTSYSLTLTTPEIPFVKGPASLEFEWCMETQKPPVLVDETNPDGPRLPAGAEPGWFGEVKGATPGLTIAVGTPGDMSEVKTITEYNGTMVPFGDSGNWDGSASWQKETIELGELSGKKVLTFTGAAQRESVLMLRKIKVDQKTGVNQVASAEGDVLLAGVYGGINISSASEKVVDVYNLLGVRVASVALAAGQTEYVELPAGVYVAAGCKVVVR